MLIKRHESKIIQQRHQRAKGLYIRIYFWPLTVASYSRWYFKEDDTMKTYPSRNHQTVANLVRLLSLVTIILYITLPQSSSVLWAQGYQIQNDRILAPEVSHFTGVNEPGVDAHGDLSLSIPLMTIPGRDGLDFPIVANYQSGIKVTQSASWIGLGWSLDLGSITRQPLGGLDGTNAQHPDWAAALIGIAPQIQSQPDIYTVTMNGSSTLLLSTTLEQGPGLPFAPANETAATSYSGFSYSQWYFIPSPWKPWKIYYRAVNGVTVDGHTSSNGLGNNKWDFEKFIIVMEDGTRYVYGQPTLSEAQFPQTGSGDFYKFVSTWRLTAILSPNYTGPIDPDATSQGGWVKIHYTTIQTIVDVNTPSKILPQIMYPEYVETPTHFAKFTLSTRYDRDLANLDNNAAIGQNNATTYYSKKIDKITLHKKDAPGPPNSLSGTEIMEISFTYLQNGAETYYAGYSSSIHGKMLSKLTLKEIKITGKSGANTKSIPAYKFDYYDYYNDASHGQTRYFSWWDILFFISSYKLIDYQDDFGFLDFKLGHSWRNPNESDGKIYSLKEIIYPEGGKLVMTYESDELSTTSFTYREYQVTGSGNSYFGSKPASFNRTKQGGPRVDKIEKFSGYNDTNPDKIEYTYGSGYFSGVPEIRFRKMNDWGEPVYYSEGERGQFNIAYASVEQKFNDNSKIITFYKVSMPHEPRMIYRRSGPTIAIFNGNSCWNWAEIDRIEYHNASGKIKEEVYGWNFWGETGSQNPFKKLATVVPALPYALPSPGGNSPAIDLNFTHKQLNNKTTKYYGNLTLSFTQNFEYNDGTLLEKTIETNTDGKQRITLHLYAHDVATVPYTNIKARNMRNQKAQTRVEDGFGNGYASTIIIWKEQAVGSYFMYLPDKSYSWRKGQTGTYTIPIFNGSTPSATEWIQTTQFTEYDNHGNLKKVKDAYNNQTDIFWIGTEASALIDKITANSGGAVPLTTDYGYDGNTFKLTSVQDPNGQSTSYEYDPLQRLEKIKDADLNAITAISYFYSRDGASGNFEPASPNKIEEKSYRALTDLTTLTAFFDGLGRKIQSQLKKTNDDIVQHFTYDPQSRPEYAYKAFVHPASHNYLKIENFPTNPAPLKEKTLYEPDPLNRVNRIVPFGVNEVTGTDKDITYTYKTDFAPDGTKCRFTETLDEREKITSEYFDFFDNRFIVVKAAGTADETTTRFAYDILGNLTQVTAPASDITTYSYNTLSQMLQKTSPDFGSSANGAVKFRYDKNGNVRFQQSEKQQVNNEFTYFKYDGINRLLEEGTHTNSANQFDNEAYYLNDPSWPSSGGVWKTKYVYDVSDITGNFPKGRLTKTEVDTNGDGIAEVTTRYKYDKFGRIIEKRQKIGVLAEKTIISEYDWQGNLKKTTYPSGMIVERTYNEQNQLYTVKKL